MVFHSISQVVIKIREMLIMKGSGRYLRIIAELGKFRITVMVCLTTLAGYLLHKGTFGSELFFCLPGIFFLASGSAALNQVQERKYDAMMDRTKGRPLPSGRISVFEAILISAVFSLGGAVMLLFGVGKLVFLLGLSACFWYNVVYTYLKKYTAYAVIPGSVIGVVPPLIGWVTGGGSLADPLVIPVGVFFYTWQVPHFFLLVLKYSKEYETAGFPALRLSPSAFNIRLQIFLWILATAVIIAVLPFTGLISSSITMISLYITGGWLMAVFTRLLDRKTDLTHLSTYFKKVNCFVIITLALLMMDKTVFFRIEHMIFR
jgi:protoheme IX farnesyltransferase